MNARRGAAPILYLLLVLTFACNGDEPAPEPGPAPEGESPDSAGQAESSSEEEEETATDSALAPLSRLRITVYFPSQKHDALVPESREIFDTASPIDRAKQILADLISGPSESIEAYPALPPGTRIRQVYILESGVAWVDFTADLKHGMLGGTDTELLSVYAVVNSLALNVPEIRRVGFLIDGRVSETLGGHLDLSRPLPANTSYILGAGGKSSITVKGRLAPAARASIASVSRRAAS
jgi:spore germination protein GerM